MINDKYKKDWRLCPGCNRKEYFRVDQKYCSKNCWLRTLKQKYHIRNCKLCGKRFYVERSDSNRMVCRKPCKQPLNNNELVIFNVKPYYSIEVDNGNGTVVIRSWSANKNGGELKQRINQDGYLVVKLGNYNKSVHQIIGEYLFKKKKGYTINHIDCNKLNNSINNLEYITIADNIKHAIKNGLHVACHPERHGNYKDGRTFDLKKYKTNWARQKYGVKPENYRV